MAHTEQMMINGVLTDVTVFDSAAQEIDDAVAKADGAVRFDLEQSLTETQKGIARLNVGAAPDGYGLGGSAVTPPNETLNDAVLSGLYVCKSGYVGAPAGVANIEYGVVSVERRSGTNIIQKYWCEKNVNIPGSPYHLMRTYDGDSWGEWEWVNPPMVAGVEYRTIERYGRAVVYAKRISCGVGPSANAKKSIAHGVENMGILVSCSAVLTSGGASSLQIPYHLSDTNYGYASADYINVTLSAGDTSLSGYTSCFSLIKYTKTTD